MRRFCNGIDNTGYNSRAAQYGQVAAQEVEPEPWPLKEYASDQKPETPSEWFSKMFPEQAKVWGCPFIELAEDRSDGLKKINPLAPNLDFLAAILGGDTKMGHKVIYLEGEMQWYFLDQPNNIFKPTTAEKLANLL